MTGLRIVPYYQGRSFNQVEVLKRSWGAMVMVRVEQISGTHNRSRNLVSISDTRSQILAIDTKTIERERLNSFSSDSREKVHISESLQSTDAVGAIFLGLDHFFIIKEHPTALASFPQVRHIMPRVDGWSFVRNKTKQAISRRSRLVSRKSGTRGLPCGWRCSLRRRLLTGIIRMVEQPIDGTLRIAILPSRHFLVQSNFEITHRFLQGFLRLRCGKSHVSEH